MVKCTGARCVCVCVCVFLVCFAVVPCPRSPPPSSLWLLCWLLCCIARKRAHRLCDGGSGRSTVHTGQNTPPHTYSDEGEGEDDHRTHLMHTNRRTRAQTPGQVCGPRGAGLPFGGHGSPVLCTATVDTASK